MTKKKAKSTATKKSAKKQSPKKSTELNPAEVRKEIAQMVESEATTMAKAVIEDGKKGQLAPFKYLLELAKIFPEPTDGSQSSEAEDCLAQTLLRRLDLPDEPISQDEDDEPKAVNAESVAGKSKHEDAVSEALPGEGSKDQAPV